MKAITGLTRKVGSTTTIHGAFQGNTHLATINIPATVITIGENAFSGSRVTTISFSGTSALTTIAKKAFYNCTRLSSITLPANLTTLGTSAFSGCSNLASVTLYTKLTSIGTDAFKGCKDGLQVTIKGTSGNTTVPANMFEGNTAIGKLELYNNINATSYDVVLPQLEQRHIAINEANFPDQNFRVALSWENIDQDNDGFLSPEEIAAVTELKLDDYGNYIASLKGIEFFTELQRLECPFFRHMTSLDLSKNTKLTYLDCQQGALTSLDISNNTMLTNANCQGNALTSLLIPNTTTLQYFTCYKNNITGAQMEAFVVSLPDVSADANEHVIYLMHKDGNDGNVITLAQVRAATAKGWQIVNSLNEPFVGSDVIIFADAAVKAICVAKWDSDEDGELTYAEAAAVTSLADVDFTSSITTFDELQYFTGLTQIPAGAFSNCTSLTHITIPANVTSIGRGAFSRCASLTDLTIPEGVTSIAEYAFQKYTGDVTLPTTLTEIGFQAVQAVNSVKVKWQTPPTTFDSSAFGTGASIGATLYVPIGCLNAYRSEPWSRFNTKKEYGNIPFADANVKAICVSKWDTDGDGELSLDEAAAVTDLNKTWVVADAIAPGSSYYIRNAGTGQFLTGANNWGVQISLSTDATPYMKVKVESLPEEDQATYPDSYMLRLDGTYSFLDAEHSNTQTKTDTYLFRSLTENYGYVDGVEGNISGCRYFRIVKNANGYFTIQSAPDAGNEINADGTEYAGANGAGAVVYFNRPVDIANTEWELIYLDESQADPFKSNTTITSFDELKYFTGLTEIPQNAFLGCTGLTSITLPSNLTAIGEDAFSGCTTLTAIAVPGSVTTIGERAFCSCWNLTDVQLEWGLKTIGEYAFSNTSALVNIEIPTTVTTLDNAFSDMDTEHPGNLKAVHVWWTSADQIPAISASTFPTRANATLYVPISYETVDGQNVEVSTAPLYQAKDVWKDFGAIDRAIYFNDQKVKEVCLANWDTNHDGELSYTEAEAVTTIAQYFKGNTEIQYFNELQYFTGITDNMGAEAFDGCTSLRSITLPNTLTVVPDKAFRNCTSLTASFFIPISVTRIGDYAFQGCTGFSVGLSSNSNLTHIGAHAFEGTKLGWIYIPANVTEYGDQAFANCANLTSVTVMRTEPIAITTDPFPNRANIRLTVPAHTSEAYAAADYWKDFAPIEESEPQWHIYTDANGVKYQYEPGYNAQLYQFNKKNQETFTVAASITVDGETLPVTAMADGSVNSTSLKELYIPASVTKLKGATFGYIDALTAIHFDSSTPPAVTSQAFEYWRISVTQAYNAWKSQYDVWKMKHEQWVANGSEGTEPVEPAPFVEPTITLYVPAGSKSAYEAADVWKDFPIVEVEGDTDISQLDNVIYIEPTNAPIGGEISLSFKMKNSAPIVGYQFNIELPEGMSVVLDEENQPILAFNEERTSFSRHDLSASRQSDGSWLVLSGSSSVLTYKGNEGEIFTMRVRVADDMAVGDYPIILRNMKLQEAGETRYYEHSRIRSTISVSEYTMGDTNGDGVIDIADYVNVAKAILGDAPAGFNRNAADIDGNGIIDITDYVGVATLILNSNNVKAQQKKVVQDIPLGTLQEK